MNKEELMKKFDLSKKIELGYLKVDDVKEFIRLIKYWSYIDLGKDWLVIKYSKFKELAGDKLK